MMDLNNNQYKLETLPKPARPTIPYAQFPRPTLEDPEASFENRRRSSTDSEGTSTSRGSFDTLDGAEEMQSGSSRQHTRRRSARRPITTDAGRNNRNGEQEEVRWSLEEDAWSEEDGKSNSDNAYSGRSDDDHDDEETGLTGARGKKSRRRRDSRLDRRIVKDSEITSEEKKEADQSVIKDMLINGMFIGLW